MDGSTMKRSASAWVNRLGLIFAVWTVLGLIAGIQAHAYIASIGHPITWRRALLPALLNHWIWAALTPAVLWLSARFPIERQRRLRVLLIHLLGAFGFAVGHLAMRLLLLPAVSLYTTPSAPVSWKLFRNMLFANGYDDMWMYGTIVAFSQLWNYYRKYQERELRASRLETQLAQAQLTVLKMQLQPHFLFNTLHAISSLMHEDVEAADDMITRLSDLLRLSLENVSQQEVALKREVEFLEGYLAIQQTRFRDRLSVHVDIDPASLDALVPNMILQPLVENAINHGTALRSTPGEISVRSRRLDGILRLQVLDNGLGISESLTEEPRRGLGLTNTRERLRQLYGDSHQFSLQKCCGGGTVVSLEIPFRVQREPDPTENSNANSHDHRG